MSAPRLVLDFDGVVCDALDECALVTWLGVHPPKPRAPVSRHLTALPRGFRERFRTVRDYSRLLDHFVVAHRPVAARIRTQGRFDAVFGSLAPQYVQEFVRTATSVRGQCRTEEPRFWLDLHTLYPGIAELLRANAGRVAVVTAKDETSVRAILDRHGLGHTVLDVIGECREKAGAMRELSRRHGVPTTTLTFVDDNLANAIQVAETGATSYWATWGYHTSDDLATARLNGPRPLALPELAMLPDRLPS